MNFTFRSKNLVVDGSLEDDFISDSLDTSTFDNVGLQLSWDGAAEGTFAVEVSNDPQALSPNADVRAAAVWDALTLSDVPTAVGSPGSWAVNLNQVPFQALRLNYTNTAGGPTGSLLQVIATGKGI